MPLFPFFPLALFLYAALRLLPGLPLRRRTKAAAAALMLFAASYHLLSRYILGSLASPELPAPVLIVQGWLFVALLLLFVMLVLRDLLLVALLLAGKAGLRARLPGGPVRQAAAMLVIALALSAYGVWQAVRPPQARTVEITLPRLPAGLDGFVVAHVTDPHVSSLLREPRTRAIVNTVLDMRPDIILLSGDILDGTVEARLRDAAPLGDLTAPHGVFSCIGNHEYYTDFAGWMSHFAELGITMLQNSHTAVDVNGAVLVIAGTADAASSRYGLPGRNLDAALAESPENAVRILLEHRPGNAAENAAKGIALQLSGHTHGGHIPVLARLVAMFNNGFVSGLYEVDAMRLYVSNGAGLWSGFPVRLGVPAEVTRIVLRSGGE